MFQGQTNVPQPFDSASPTRGRDLAARLSVKAPSLVFVMRNSFAAVVGVALLAFTASARAQFDHEHRAWGELLKQNVVVIDGGRASRVRYAAIARDRAALTAYLAGLSRVSEPEFKSWSNDQQLAFLINAYNAHMIELVLTRYPDIKSAWDFGKLFNHPFRRKFFTLFGRGFSLDNVEHDTIRAKGVYDDPRIHMAVNCASIGCPMLREEPFVAEKLDRQLEEQVVRFLSDRTRNRYFAPANVLEVSEVFKWYSVDFTSGLKGILSREHFFARYAAQLADDPEHRKAIRDRKAAIRFLDYDWRLNDAVR